MTGGIIRTVVALLALVAALSGPRASSAQGAPGAFTLQPGGTATITFESFCLDYGKKFPDSIWLPPTSTAEPGVAGAVNYA